MTPAERAKVIETWPEWKREDYEERAAIVQFGASTSKELAERYAFEMVKDRKEPQ